MPQKVTVDDMERAIRQAEKPVTAREIAEACGVTRQTISNYRDELDSHPRIEHGKVGTATAYWLAGDDGLPEETGDGPAGLADNIDDHAREMGEMLAGEEESDEGPVRDVEDSASSGPERTFTPEPSAEQIIATYIRLLASRQAWAGFVGLILLSFVFTVGATVAPIGILAAVLAHAAQITGAVGLGLGVLGAFAAAAVRQVAGKETGEMVGETA